MFAIRDRFVVRSSVIPSAKHCCSESLLRLANGNATIDRRGATRRCAIDVAAATAGAGGDFVIDQNHHVLAAMTSAAAAAAPIAAGAKCLRRGASLSTFDAGRSAIASGRSA